MDMCDIEVDKNQKYSSKDVSRGTEKTSETSKNKDGESGVVCNSIILTFTIMLKNMSIDVRARVHSIESNIELYSRTFERVHGYHGVGWRHAQVHKGPISSISKLNVI